MAATFVEQDRGTFARSHVVHAPEFREEIRSSETRTFEAFESFDKSDAYLSPSIATSSAWLESQIGGGRADARGGSTSIGVVPERDRRLEAPADSFFELIFDAEEGEPFRLQGQVDALAFDAEGFASVEIVEIVALGEGVIVTEHAAGAGEWDRFDVAGTLAAGRYRLTAFALTHGEVEGDAASPAALASFRTVFSLPEPSPNTATAVSLLVLAWLARARRRAS